MDERALTLGYHPSLVPAIPALDIAASLRDRDSGHASVIAPATGYPNSASIIITSPSSSPVIDDGLGQSDIFPEALQGDHVHIVVGVRDVVDLIIAEENKRATGNEFDVLTRKV
jgi:hypothetical protein